MVKVYINNLKLEIKKSLEYKASFILDFISQIAIFFTYYFLIIALFQKFNDIKGFTMYEVLLCFSIINIGFSFNEIFFRGIDKFENFIIDGSLDRLLVRPYPILFQVIASTTSLSKLSRTLQAVIIMVIALTNINIELNIEKILLLILMIIASIAVFFSVFTIVASYCFITVHGLEIKNVFTDGGKHLAQYPMGIYKKGVLFFFTFIIPYACVNYYPLLYFLDKSDNILYMFSPLLAIFFIFPAILLFNRGIKHYTSTGS